MHAIARDRFGKSLQVSVAEPGVVTPQAVNIEKPGFHQRHAGKTPLGMRPIDGHVLVDVVHFPEHRVRDHDEYVARPLVAKLARRSAIEDVSVQDGRGMEERTQTDYVFHGGVAALPPIQEPMRVAAAVLIYLQRIVGAYSEVGIGLEKIDLLLQFMGRGPIVVAFEDGQIFTCEGKVPTVEVLLLDLETDIFLVEVWLDDVWILSDIPHYDFLRSVRGAILNHVDFKVEIGLL